MVGGRKYKRRPVKQNTWRRTAQNKSAGERLDFWLINAAQFHHNPVRNPCLEMI